MTGQEMLMGAALKALGITPEQMEAMKTAIPKFAQEVHEKVTAIDARLTAIEATQQQILEAITPAKYRALERDHWTAGVGATEQQFCEKSDCNGSTT